MRLRASDTVRACVVALDFQQIHRTDTAAARVRSSARWVHGRASERPTYRHSRPAVCGRCRRRRRPSRAQQPDRPTQAREPNARSARARPHRAGAGGRKRRPIARGARGTHPLCRMHAGDAPLPPSARAASGRRTSLPPASIGCRLVTQSSLSQRGRRHCPTDLQPATLQRGESRTQSASRSPIRPAGSRASDNVTLRETRHADETCPETATDTETDTETEGL